VANHPLIVDLPALDFKNLACVTMPGVSIRVFSDSGLCSKCLGKTLRAATIDHARSTGVLIATGGMDHELLDKLKQFIIVNWEFRRHKTVNVLWSVQLGIRLKKDNNVGMRETMLLKFNSVEIGSHFP